MAAADAGSSAVANSVSSFDVDRLNAGRDVRFEVRQYFVSRAPYDAFQRDPLEPWDQTSHGVIEVDNLRKKLLQNKPPRPVRITVRGTLFPCALLTPGWWERQDDARDVRPPWNDKLQKWLFHGFDLWGPSWDFSWALDDASAGPGHFYIAQLGDGDEADSIPVVIPHEKAVKLQPLFEEGWGGLEVDITGLLGHRRHFPRMKDSLMLVGGTLDYCLWVKEDDPDHRISLRSFSNDVYSGYLWKCVAPRAWMLEDAPLCLSNVYFIWEHTNFVDRDAILYNLDSLDHKESYIRSMYGDLVLLQKSSSLVPGDPEWSTAEFYDLLMGKQGTII